LADISPEAAYPRIEFLPRSRNWWAWLKGSPPECIHLDREAPWIATLLPDTLYLGGKKTNRRDRVRPEVSLCYGCLSETIRGELETYEGNVIAFEPDPQVFTQYFFITGPDFEAAGVAPDVAAAIEKRLVRHDAACVECGQSARWLWFSQEQVASLDEVDRIAEGAAEPLCAAHGAEKLLASFAQIPEANLFYMNLPYGESGAYLWI
jgi:hypothetical protein